MIFVPTSPALVPELGRGDSDSAMLLRVARTLIDDVCARHPVASISLVGSTYSRTYTAHTGSFRAWGASGVSVGAGNYLAELVLRYVVGDSSLPISATPFSPGPSVLTLVGVDGPAGLSDKAPLSLVPGARERHEWCEHVLRGDAVSWPEEKEELRRDGIIEPGMWWLLRNKRPIGPQLHVSSDAHGVGRYLATWEGVE